MEAKLAVHLDWVGVDRWTTTHGNGRALPYRQGGEENYKLELGRARFKAGWGQMAKGVNGGARGAMNRAMVTSPCWI